jgi:uncharacterized membrane protein
MTLRTAARTAVAPTHDDPVADVAQDAIGGPVGHYARRTFQLVNVSRVLLLGTLFTLLCGVVYRAPCIGNGWTKTEALHQPTEQYTHLCYTDVPHVFQGTGLLTGRIPYLDIKGLGYPTLAGAAMRVASWVATNLGAGVITRTQWFYAVTVWLLMIFAAITVLALIGLAGRRPWDAAIFAFSPMLLLTGTMNWDLLAVGLSTVGLLAFSRRHAVIAGLFVGFAQAVKFYPAMLLIALLVLCWRAGRMRAWCETFGGALVGWALVNLPVLLVARHGWTYYYTASRDQAESIGTVWTAFEQLFHFGMPGINVAVSIALGALWLAVALLGLLARERPRIGQLAFLCVAAYVIANKAYAPQETLWLLPLAALARPRWRDVLIWQSCEMLYFVAFSFEQFATMLAFPNSYGLPENLFNLTVFARVGGLIFLCVQVIRDILDPARDPIRVDGSDDPAGGVLNGAGDVYGFAPLHDHDYELAEAPAATTRERPPRGSGTGLRRGAR